MYIIYDIEKGNEEAAFKDINSRYFKFSQSVKGFVGSWEPLMGIEEALSLISMAAPSD